MLKAEEGGVGNWPFRSDRQSGDAVTKRKEVFALRAQDQGPALCFA